MAREFGYGSSASAADFNRIKVSQHQNMEAEDSRSSEQTSPLGLRLSKTPSFLNLVQMVISRERTDNATNNISTRARIEAKINNLPCQSHYNREKLKAANFPASLLRIGSFERISRYEEDLIAKFYYAKKKIVWEVLQGPVKSKMEIQWSDIEAIRANIHGSEQGILEIELNQPPLFFKETNPQPRKHTLWQPTSDFTRGQALKCRRHIVHFPPLTLEKHYEKLLQCDHRLLELSRKPFPSEGFPYFQPNFYPFNITFGRQQVNIPSSLDHSHHLSQKTYSHFQVLNLGQHTEAVNVHMFSEHGEDNWTRDENIYVTENHTEGLPPCIDLQANEGIDHRDNILGLTSKTQFVWPDGENIRSQDGRMCSFFGTRDGLNNTGINHVENKTENIGNYGSILGSGEILEYDGHMIDSMNLLASDNDFVMISSDDRYGLSNLKVQKYEPLDTNRTDYQWS